ncbi:Crp/Fnr family transcriptional regulator [Telluribacter humicola]|uniref:Crp/Fnr family transcriptional regulator n=1 Tax=Telluribacter humicola TaxID=1720261 RepID=UPI001A95FE3E|nr:cyclic nucleotide-binding domain-containing protein [Telluribacter humicola]
MEPLKAYLSRYMSLSDAQIELLVSYLKEVKLEAGDYFLREGNVCRHIGFVTEGVLRVLHFDRDDEVTRYFISNGNLAVLPDSFRHQAPATENIQAVTDTHIWILKYEDMVSLFGEIPAWGRLVQRLVEEVQRQRALGRVLASQNVQTRLNNFDEEYPGLIDVIPEKILASYLRMSPLELKKSRQSMIGNQPSNTV